MAVPSQNMTSVVSGGPNMSLAGGYVFGPGDVQAPAFVGVGTFTGDGTIATSNLNFIDGTNAIPFVPSYVRISKVGGNDTNAGLPLLNTSAALNNVAVSVIWSIAPASGKTSVILAELYK
jgi:hypothetical protein